MGSEIFYCSACKTLLRSRDFQKGLAYRFPDQVACKGCVDQVLGPLPPAERERLLEAAREAAGPPGPDSSRVQPILSDDGGQAQHEPPTSMTPRKAFPPVRSEGNSGIWIGVGAVLLVVIVVAASTSSRPPAPRAAPKPDVVEVAPIPPSPPVPRPEPPPDPRPRPPSPAPMKRLESARKMIADARAFATAHPDDLQGQLEKASQAALEASGTDAAVEGKALVEEVRKRIREKSEAAAAVKPEPVVVKPEPPKVPDVPKPAEPPKPAPPDPKPAEPAVKPPPPAPTRPAVPDAAKQRDAEAALKKAFPIDQAKTAKEKADLARTLLSTASTSGAKEADLWVLLRVARDWAAQGLDAKTALEAIDAMAAAFEVDAFEEKAAVLTKTQVKGPDAAGWAGTCLKVSEEAEEAGDYEAAVKLSSRAEALASTAKDVALLSAAKDRSKELLELKREADRLKTHFKTLEGNADDPVANTAVGKFLCLVKDDWKKGLPLLAKGADEKLKELAKKELEIPLDAAAEAQAALGEGWAAQAKKEFGRYSAGAKAQAAGWLERAIPGLTGRAKISAQNTLTSLGQSSATKVRVISINFTDTGDKSAVLEPGVAAGVVSRPNWNNYPYNASSYGLNPKDDSGRALVGTYVNYRIHTGYQGRHDYTSTVGNDYLMKYFCGNDEGSSPTDRTQRTLIRVSGLPASFTAGGYSVYVYSDWKGDNTVIRKFDLGTSILDGANPNAGMTVLSTATSVDSTDWLATGNPTGILTEGAAGTVGNYVVFRNQTASEFAIFPYAAGPTRTAINGIQIVSNGRFRAAVSSPPRRAPGP